MEGGYFFIFASGGTAALFFRLAASGMPEVAVRGKCNDSQIEDACVGSSILTQATTNLMT
jgi:hypothetical protein